MRQTKQILKCELKFITNLHVLHHHAQIFTFIAQQPSHYIRLIQSIFWIGLSIHHLTMAVHVVAYKFHTNLKHSESTLFKNFLSCIILSTVSNFRSKVSDMACTCNTRASAKKQKHRPRRLIWHDSRLSWLATRRLYPTDSLEKIKRLFALYCSTYWHTWYNKLQIKTSTLVHRLISRWKNDTHKNVSEKLCALLKVSSLIILQK